MVLNFRNASGKLIDIPFKNDDTGPINKYYDELIKKLKSSALIDEELNAKYTEEFVSKTDLESIAPEIKKAHKTLTEKMCIRDRYWHTAFRRHISANGRRLKSLT